MTTHRPIVAFLLLLFLAAPALAQEAEDPEGADASVKYGVKRYRAGDYGEAILAGKEALAAVPGHPQGAVLLGNALLITGGYEDLEKAMRAAIEKKPENARAHALLGEVLAVRGRLDDARRALEKAVLLDPKIHRARAVLGEVALRQGDRAAAEVAAKALLDAIEGGAADVDTTTTEDLMAFARGCLIADRVPALKSKYRRHMFHYARDLYQRAYDVDPEDPDILARWARLYMDQWNLAEARKLLKEAEKQNEAHPEIHVVRATALLRDFYGGTDRYAEARRAIERVLATNPSHVDAHVLLADLLITDALYDDALAAVDKATAVDPQHTEALATRAAIHRIRGETRKYEAIEASVGQEGPRAAEFYTRVASLVDSKFRYQEAHELCQRAVLADPDFEPAYAQLGLAAMRTGDEKEARRFLEKANQANPFDLFVVNLLTLLDHLDKQFETFETPHYVIRLDKGEAKLLRPYVEELLERSYKELAARYKVELEGKILFELFPSMQDFSVRAVAHRFIPASGVTFAHVVAVVSPGGLPPGTHNYGRTIWHEIAHVITLEKTKHRIPRWLTEGISVFEEQKGHPSWKRESDKDLMDALSRGRLLPVRELDQGFSKPRFPNQVMLSYYQGGLICEFVEAEWGMDGILKLLEGYRDAKPIDAIFKDGLDVTPEQFDRRFRVYAADQFRAYTYRPPVGPEELAALARAAKAGPKDVKAQTAYARGALDNGKLADADTAAARVLAVEPRNADAILVRAGLAARRKDRDKAVELALEALTLKTSDPFGAHLLLVSIYAGEDPEKQERRDVRQAIAHLEAARALFPKHVALYPQLAALYKEAGDEAKRQKILEEYAVLESKDAGVRLDLARTALGGGDHARAKKLLDEAVWIAPQHPLVHILWGEAHLAGGGDALAARAALERAQLALEGLAGTLPPAALAPIQAQLEGLKKKVEEAERKKAPGAAPGGAPGAPGEPPPPPAGK